MNLFKNKYFILGNIILVLLVIPLTLFFVSKQQEVRSRATASSKLFFNPATINKSKACTSFFADITLDPGTNIVTTVKLSLTYDPAILEITNIVPEPNLSLIGEKTVTSGVYTATYGTGTNPQNLIQTTQKVARVTFKPLAPGASTVQFGTSTAIRPQESTTDLPTENVLSSSEPLSVTIANSETCDVVASGTPSVTTTVTVSPGTGTNTPTPTRTPTPTTPSSGGTATPTTSPTSSSNVKPVCTEFTANPGVTGAAPFSVLLGAKGNDSNGTITQATFTFGDGQTQNIAQSGKDINTQTNHTYQNAGTFNASVVFTDNNGAVSDACTKVITVSASTSTTTSPTATGTITATPTGATATPTTVAGAGTGTATATPSPTTTGQAAVTPTIAATGSVASTVTIIGVILLTVIGGIFLLAL